MLKSGFNRFGPVGKRAERPFKRRHIRHKRCSVHFTAIFKKMEFPPLDADGGALGEDWVEAARDVELAG